MSASNYYKSTQSSCSNNSSCEDEENYITSSRGLKYEDEQIYITEENSDSFNEKKGLVSNNFSLQNHEKVYQAQQQKLNAIKNLIDPSDQQYQQLGNNGPNAHSLTSFIHSQLQNPQCNSLNNLNQPSAKSKKEILKEKRDKKKQQIYEKRVIFEGNQNQDSEPEKKKEFSKEEKAERQKIKNRESAQLSRDRKKLIENQMQQDLQFLTDENKHLQSLIKQQYTCQQCGFFNNPNTNGTADYSSSTSTKQQFQNCKENHIQLTSDSIQYRNPQNNQNFGNAPLQQGVESSNPAAGPVYQFFDFSRTNAPLLQTSPINFCSFGKGAWSTAFIIFVIYMMLVFSGSQQDSNTTLGQNFRNLQFVGPYAQFFEQYKNFTQEQLLEELLKQIEQLKDFERDDQLKQLKLIQMLANAATGQNTTPGTEEPSTTAELNESQKTTVEEHEKDFIIEESQSQTSSSSTAANSALLEKIQALEKEVTIESQPVQQDFLDFCKKYKDIQNANESERSYYKDLSKKLDELQKEKLSQLENLKQIYCINPPDSPSFGSEDTASSKRNSNNQFYSPKIMNPVYSEKQLTNQALNPLVLQESSIDKLRNSVVVEQSQYLGSQQNGQFTNNFNNSPPTFDNISQFFNDTASFKDEGGMNSSPTSSQELDTEDDQHDQRFTQEQQQYQQYRSQMRQNQMQQQYYNEQNQGMEDHHGDRDNLHMIGEEEDPYNMIPQILPKKSSINYYELMQRKNGEAPQQQQQQQQQQSSQSQTYSTQHINCQYSFQQNPHQIEEYQNSNSTNSVNLQNVYNGKVQQFNLQFSPYHQSNSINNGKDESQFFQNYDVEKYIKFSCKFVDNNCIKKENY